ncbi:hypothetical protein CPB83DRAFT_742704, partial [Crepidotus variabilis]
LGGVVNVRESHWVAFVISIEEQLILYGDSLSLSDDTVVNALSWWISIHCEELFTVQQLPIGLQSDGISCGLFAVNALSHYFFP